MLAAYTLVASENSQIKSFRDDAIIFIDPTINPDGTGIHNGLTPTKVIHLYQTLMMLSTMRCGLEEEQTTIGLI